MPCIEEHLVDRLCGAFDLGAPKAVRLLGGTRNMNYALDTDLGRWFLRKRHHAYCGEERMAFDNAALLFLYQREVAVPRIVVTGDGSPFFSCDDGVWQVFEWVAGRQLQEGNLGDMEALGIGLAKFHDAGRSFPDRMTKLGAREESDPEVILQQAASLEAGNDECSDILRRYRSWTVEAAATLPDHAYAALSATLVHGDIQPANILINDGHVAAFVDFDWCSWQPRIYDIAYALLFCCTSHATPIEGDDIWSLTQPPLFQHDAASAFVTAYDSSTEPLTQDERRALSAQLVLTWCQCRIAGALKVEPVHRRAFLERNPTTVADILDMLPAVWR